MKRDIKFRVWRKEENPTKRKGKGTHKQNGYVMQYAPYHPYANKRGYVMEHRLFYENTIGRYLMPRKELIHHIDGVKDNNSIRNLVLSNPKDHAKGHIGERNNNGTFIASEPIFNELKYRLYDSDRNITRIYTLQELISKTFRRGKFEYRGRYTGLKDKNGVEIYEGDKMKDIKCNYAHGIVVFIGGKFVIDAKKRWTIYSCNYEVIGNIHTEAKE